MGRPNVGVGAQRTDRTISLANNGYMAIPPAAPTLGEPIAGVGGLNSSGLGVESDRGTELLNIVGGDRDDNGGGIEPLHWVGLEEASIEDRDLDGIPDRFRKCRAKLIRVLGEICCGELVDGELHIIWG